MMGGKEYNGEEMGDPPTTRACKLSSLPDELLFRDTVQPAGQVLANAATALQPQLFHQLANCDVLLRLDEAARLMLKEAHDKFQSLPCVFLRR